MIIRTLLVLSASALLATLVMAQGPAGSGAHAPMHAPASPGEVRIGDIVISAPFARATLPRAPVGGGFLTLTNTGTTDDRLVSASAPVGRDTQIHEMAVVNDVMRMRQLGDGIPLPAGETVTLAPGGLHLMFMGLAAPLVEGESVPVTLNFETAGTITIDMPIAGTAADGAMQHGAAGHGNAGAVAR